MSWLIGCPDCAKLASGDCGKHGPYYPLGQWPYPDPLPYIPPVYPYQFYSYPPPAVCTGSQTPAVDLQGYEESVNYPKEGVCGVCGQKVKVDGYLKCVTHPYLLQVPETEIPPPPPPPPVREIREGVEVKPKPALESEVDEIETMFANEKKKDK